MKAQSVFSPLLAGLFLFSGQVEAQAPGATTLVLSGIPAVARNAAIKTEESPVGIRSNVPLNEISTHAFRHFHRVFRNASQENWFKMEDGYIVSFTENSRHNQAHYDIRGFFLYSLKYFAAQDVSGDLKERVYARYPGYAINVVTEINTGDKILYLVNIIGDHSIKTLSVHEGQMEIVEDKVVERQTGSLSIAAP